MVTRPKAALESLIRDRGDAPARMPRPMAPALAHLAGAVEAGVQELDPAVIDNAPWRDRMSDGENFEAFKASIEKEGQLQPILVRMRDGVSDRYEVVFGHRRLRAMRELGQPVKAMVRRLSDQQAMAFQARENQQREDLTYIERALHAYRLNHDHRVKQVDVAEILGVQQSDASVMMRIVRAVTPAIIEAIGPAPGIGRPRWAKLAERFDHRTVGDAREVLSRDAVAGARSDERFQALEAAFREDAQRPVKQVVEVAGKRVTITVSGKRVGVTASDPDSAKRIADRLPGLLAGVFAEGQ